MVMPTRLPPAMRTGTSLLVHAIEPRAAVSACQRRQSKMISARPRRPPRSISRCASAARSGGNVSATRRASSPSAGERTELVQPARPVEHLRDLDAPHVDAVLDVLAVPGSDVREPAARPDRREHAPPEQRRVVDGVDTVRRVRAERGRRARRRAAEPHPRRSPHELLVLGLRVGEHTQSLHASRAGSHTTPAGRRPGHRKRCARLEGEQLESPHRRQAVHRERRCLLERPALPAPARPTPPARPPARPARHLPAAGA